LKILSKIPKTDMDLSTEVARIEVYFLDNCAEVSDWCVNYYNKGGESIDVVSLGTDGYLQPVYFYYKKDAVRYARKQMSEIDTCKEVRVFTREYNLLHKVIHKGGPTITLSKEDAIILDNNIEVA
jgi:hypothetical protein